jgi:lipopolysaccharide biosynthesis glycosyltransferase
MKKNVLVTLADANHIDQAKQLFSSVYWNAGWDGDYLLLAHDIPESALAWFEQKGISIYRCLPLGDKNREDIYPMTVFSKLYLFKGYFKKWAKAIYLDADIIVTASLDGLKKVDGFGAKSDFDTDLNHQINLCYNYDLNDATWTKRARLKLEKRYDLSSLSFNSGVMVIDTNIIQEDSFDRLMSLWKEYRNILTFGDQLVLNLFMYHKWRQIEAYYNALPLDKRMRHVFFDKKVIMPVLHFVGPLNKPWQEGNQFMSLWKSNVARAEEIDLRLVPPAQKHSPEELARSNKIVIKNERPFILACRHFFDIRELDMLYYRKNMKEFRRLLIRSILKGYSRGYDRFIPYLFLSYVPENFKDRIKNSLRRWGLGRETDHASFRH